MRTIQSKVTFLFLAVLFFACDNEIEPIDNDGVSENFDPSSVDVVLSKLETSVLMTQGINPLEEKDLERKEVTIFGKTFKGLAIGDYFIEDDNLNNLTKVYDNSKSNNLTARYASTNRIALPAVGKRNVRVGVIIDGIDAIPGGVRTAVRAAVVNYNRLNMNKLTMSYAEITEDEANSGADEQGVIDIVFFLDSRGNFVGNADGRAFFPSNGNTGIAVGLSANTVNFSFKNNTLLALHEMGHTLGMAHSDFLTRSTCGNTTPLDPELGDLLGIPNVSGVCNIAGTSDSGNQFISIMRSCGFFIWPAPDFTERDKDAFKVLYSQVELPCATEDSVLIDPDCISDPDVFDFVFANLSTPEIGRLFQAGILCGN